MQANEAVIKVLSWRWTPFFGIVGATLLYIVFAIILVPTELEAKPETDRRRPLDLGSAPASDTGETTSPDFNNNSVQPLTRDSAMGSPLERRRAAREEHQSQRRRGFSPPLEQPEPPPSQPDPVANAAAVASQQTANSAAAPEEPQPKHRLLRHIEGLRERFQPNQPGDPGIEGPAVNEQGEVAVPDGQPPTDDQQNMGDDPGQGEVDEAPAEDE